MEQFKRIDTTLLYPPFVGLVAQLLSNLEAQGHVFVATSGFRSVEEQDALFAKGGVTHARGGYSAHNYGVGVDLCHDKDDRLADGLQPDYAGAHYDVLGAEAAKLGLEWGGSWTSLSDRPHIQLPLKTHMFTWTRMLGLYRQGGIEAVWKVLDTVSW